jgi:hypothetical protein
MPSQIVVLPVATLEAILNHSTFTLQIAFCSRHMHPRVSNLGSGLRVEIDRPTFCPALPNRLHDDVYAILLTADIAAPGLVQPMQLPDDLVHRALGEVEAALVGLHRLSDHDRMEIAASIAQATTALAISIPPVGRRSIGSTEIARRRRAAALQKVLRPELSRLDHKLARYGRFVRKARLESAVVRLGLQADLGAALRVAPNDRNYQPSLTRRHRRGEFQALWQSTQNLLGGFQDCLDRIHRNSSEGSNWLNDALLPLHSRLLSRTAHSYISGRFRSQAMWIRSACGNLLHETVLSAQRVPEATRTFADGFDARLWRDFHPLVRAGMAHIELMTIHPFCDGNGRLGRLLLQAMLIEHGLPGLPLEAVFTWNRHTYLTRVDAAARKADLLGFMQFLLRAVDKAIDLGRHFAHGLRQHREDLIAAFSEPSDRFATIAAEHAASMVVGPDDQFVQRVMMDPNCVCDYLRDTRLDAVSTGTFDVSGHRIPTGWSSAVARELLIAPPAWI